MTKNKTLTFQSESPFTALPLEKLTLKISADYVQGNMSIHFVFPQFGSLKWSVLLPFWKRCGGQGSLGHGENITRH